MEAYRRRGKKILWVEGILTVILFSKKEYNSYGRKNS